MSSLLYGLAVLFGIGFLIFIHELGHCLCARWIGVRVEVFSLGFGPRLFGFERGGTDYRVSLVPLGGYVAVAGHDPGDRRYPASLCLWSKTVGQRALYFSGGVIMNMLFALITLPLVFRSGVEFVAPAVGQVVPGSPAWEAGLQPGDRIVALDGKPMYSFENLFVEVALASRRAVQLEVRRGEQTLLIEAQPRFDADDGLAKLGITEPVEQAPATLQVLPGTAAHRAGLRNGDVLVAVDDRELLGREAAEALMRLDDANQGRAARLRVRRGGQELEFTVGPADPTDQVPARIGVEPLARLIAGLRPGLPLVEDLGLQRGDRLLAVDGTPYRGPDLSVAATGGDRLRLRILRDGVERDLSAPATPEARRALQHHVALAPDEQGMLLMPREGSPARAAGLQPGDHVVAVDGVAVPDWAALKQQVQDAAPGQELLFDLRRDGQPLRLAITPQRQDTGIGAELTILRTEVRHDNLAAAVGAGFIAAGDLVKQLYVTLKRMITGQVAAKNLGGIITISRVSYHMAQWGPSRFLFFLAVLSINLAFINVLPIPVLDGGYLLFLMIEKIKGSPVSARMLGYSQMLGLVFVLALLVFVTYHDLLRWL